MNTTFEKFVDAHLRIGNGLLSSTVAVANAYIAFNNGSTAGKLKLYAYIQAIPGVSKVRSEFHGVELVTMPAAAPIPTPPTTGLSEFEKRMLELAEEKMRRKELFKKQEQERLAKEKAEEQERLAKEKAEEQERLAKEKAEEQERLAKEKAEEQERLAKEKAEEQERLAKEKAEEQERLAKEKAEEQERLAKEKAEEQERLAKEKAEEQERLAKEKAEEQEREERWRKEDQEQAARFHRDEQELPKILTQMKMAHQERLQRNEQAYLTRENNKNRLITVMTHHNEFRDLLMYGTPSTVIAESESAKKLVSYSMYDHVNIHKQSIVDLVKDAIGLACTKQPVIKDGKETTINSISSDDVPKIIEGVEDKLTEDELKIVKPALSKLASHLSDAKMAVKSDYRHIPSEKSINIEKQDPIKNKTPMPKIKYVRTCNKLRTESAADGSVRTVISCYCCDQELDLHSSACHRAHDTPQSKGGDWSFQNIYLTCATCNQDMGDEIHVIEYKTQIYAKIYE